MPELKIPLTDELASALMTARVDAVGVCLTALKRVVDTGIESVQTEKMTKQTESKMGRPRKGDAGEKRIYRSVGLSGSNWGWLEQIASASDKSINDVLDSVVATARQTGFVLPVSDKSSGED